MRPSDYESDQLPTAPLRYVNLLTTSFGCFLYYKYTKIFKKTRVLKEKITFSSEKGDFFVYFNLILQEVPFLQMGVVHPINL